MHITIDLNGALSATAIEVIKTLARCAEDPQCYERHTITPAVSGAQPQPEVGDNTGTSSTGITLSPGAAGVGEGAGAAASAGQQATPSAPETSAPPAEKRTRKPKETAAAPVGEPAPSAAPVGEPAPSAAPAAEAVASSATAAAETSVVAASPAADPAPKLTIDDVRAKLQAFTGAKGIDAGLALLGEFKAGRISELKAEDYPAFVGKCALSAEGAEVAA